MEQIPCWEANCLSASQVITRILGNSKFYFRIPTFEVASHLVQHGLKPPGRSPCNGQWWVLIVAFVSVFSPILLLFLPFFLLLLLLLWEVTVSSCTIRYKKANTTKVLSVHHFRTLYLTLYLLTWRIWWAPNNASKGQVGFNSAFKGLKLLYRLKLYRFFITFFRICFISRSKLSTRLTNNLTF
jgi:hypothetical protein